jgi:hypothetical protein
VPAPAGLYGEEVVSTAGRIRWVPPGMGTILGLEDDLGVATIVVSPSKLFVSRGLDGELERDWCAPLAMC